MLSLRRYVPDSRLKPYLTTYYLLEGTAPPAGLFDTLLPELANIRLLLRGSWATLDSNGRFVTGAPALAFGFSSRPRVIRLSGQFQIFGVGLTALGWAHMIGAPAADVVDGMAELSQLLGRGPTDRWLDESCAARTDRQLTQLADRFFARCLLRQPMPVDLPIAAIDCRLQQPDGVTVSRWAAALDVSARQLERWTQRAYGMTPGLLLRKARFQATMRELLLTRKPDFLDAAALRYFDQSHFIREFKRFTGDTPGRYFARMHPVWAPAQQTIAAIDAGQMSAERVVPGKPEPLAA